MSYREPRQQQQTSAELAELSAYEAQLIRRSKRKKIVMWVVFTVMLTTGLGACFGPIAWSIGEEAWRDRKVPLTSAEQKVMEDSLAPVEANVKKSQAAFEAIWPKIRSREIGARKDLGRCTVHVPGPALERKENSRSLEESAGAYGWTFIDMTPADERSPLATLKMPRGSFALNNAGTGDRYVLPAAPLRTAAADRAPALSSSSLLDDAARLRESGLKLRANQHEGYIKDLHTFASDGMGIDVIVFLDFWQDPKMTSEMAPAQPPPKDDLEAFTRPTERPARLFEAGFAVAHAVAWDPATQKVVCAAQAVAMSSEHITFRSDQLEPLQQDLVLELERELQRSFVVAGDAPPTLEPPVLSKRGDAGAPSASPSSSAADPRAPAPRPKRGTKKYGEACTSSTECPSDGFCSAGRCMQGPM